MRRWDAWQRHITLFCPLAHAFLVVVVRLAARDEVEAGTHQAMDTKPWTPALGPQSALPGTPPP